MHVLAGDIGGTKTILRLCHFNNGELLTLAEQRYESKAYVEFEQLLSDFLETHAGSHVIQAACIGVAGPIEGKKARVTNLSWVLDGEKLAHQLQLPSVHLINDFEAVGYGIETLRQDDLVTLQQGTQVQRAVRAVIGAGTGLGQATLVWNDSIHGYQVFASEGGHSHFAPSNEQQVELWRYISKHYSQVSLEQVLSGPGISNIFDFLRNKNSGKLTTELSSDLGSGDNTPVIVEYALQEKDPVAVETLALFVDIYGSAAGNLALTVLARGGVYIAGGIAPRIIESLRDGRFVSAFQNKSKMKALLESIPVHIVVNPKVGLQGAANYAVKIGSSLSPV